MRKLLITGAGGFIAGAVIRQATSDWELHALSSRPPLTERPGLVWHTIDLKQPAAVRDAVARIGADVVLHAAAIGDIDFCEAHPEAARAANVELTSAVCDGCAGRDCRLIYLSTDTVFDGQRGRYNENDPPSPINEYARTKAEAESIAAHADARALIVRTALVMGFGLLGTGNSFLDRSDAMLRNKRTIYVPLEEVRTPIDVITLARGLLELAASDHCGTIHLAGNDALDRLTLTRRLAQRLGHAADLIAPRSPGQFAGRAPRPRDVSLDNGKARSLLRTPMLSFDDALTLVLSLRPE